MRRYFKSSGRKLNAGVQVFLAIAGVTIIAWTTFSGSRTAQATDISITSLKGVRVPEPININEFVKDKVAVIRLGKALFWDMQVGSDGVQACASCHFKAGADDRFKNQITPGFLKSPIDTAFTLPGPNGTMTPGHFPLTSFLRPDQPGFEQDPTNTFVHSTDDAMSSQGVRHFNFIDIIKDAEFERGKLIFDSAFNVEGKNVRRVEPRNTPTVINSVFNFSNFWDGRARNIFNGVNPFGELDEAAKVFVLGSHGMEAVQVRIPDASLASQAVGPPVSDFEMSSAARTFPKIAKKLLSLRPLRLQRVHHKDSVLGELAHEDTGLKASYKEMIRAAFHNKWWASKDQMIKFKMEPSRYHHGGKDDPRSYYLDAGYPTILAATGESLNDDEFSQMEANFSLFFGLAVQLYEATLVSDDSKWDRVQEGREIFTPTEAAGQTAFGVGRCGGCHRAPEFTAHSVSNIRSGLFPVAPGFLPDNAFDQRATGGRLNPPLPFNDTGMMNLAVRPAGSVVPGFPGFVAGTEDVGRGGTAPIKNPITGQPYPFSFFRLAELKAQNLLPPEVAKFVPDLPAPDPSASPSPLPGETEAVDGAQKAPGLRNVELTGPYFHNGDASTLDQVVEFYARGGNFPLTNAFNRDNAVRPIAAFAGNPLIRSQLVAFLKTLTDERVRNESAPFDHPEIFVPNGSPGDEKKLRCKGDEPRHRIHESFCDTFIKIPDVGADGRSAEGLPPLDTFLGL